jgi:methylenetetrahydrofolate dehydrogenase (NADP+)/methenyltetrahydrofolate cyclohydrolase
MDPASQVYVRSKGKATVEAGMASLEHALGRHVRSRPACLIETLNADPAVDGILVQLPLPAHLDEQKVIATISRTGRRRVPRHQRGPLSVGQPGFVPCTPLGCLMLLKDRLGNLSGLGCRGDRPFEHRRQADGAAARGKLHGDRGAQPHPQPAGRGARADIVVAAVGGPNW